MPLSKMCPMRQGHHPLDMVAHVQPWMFLAILPMVFTVEGPELTYKTLTHFQNEYQPFVILGFIFMGGVLAFMMELSEYLLLVNTSGITLNILGIVKEVITLLLAHHLHGDKLTRINLFGLILCIAGMLIHGAAKHNRQRLLQRHNERMVKLDSSVIKPSEMDDRRLLLVNEL
jgi:solute carrier family 35 protein C2